MNYESDADRGNVEKWCAMARLAPTLAKLALAALCMPGLVQPSAASDLEDGRAAIITGDYARALDILRPLAQAGDAGAQVALGAMYAQGLGVPMDLELARGWFSKSARQGNEKARFNLLHVADVYLYGEGAERRCTHALTVITELVAMEYVPAYTTAGNFFYEGCGEVAARPTEAIGWWVEAADSGDPIAMANLGVAYASGVGVEQDFAKAMSWYRRSAEKGHAAGQYGVGMMYQYGDGVPQDVAEARRWYELAAAQGDARATQALDELNAGSAPH
jgi:hypothetical protein